MVGDLPYLFVLFSPTSFFSCLFSIQVIVGSFPGFLVLAAAFYADVYAAADVGVVVVVMDDDVVACCSC